MVKQDEQLTSDSEELSFLKQKAKCNEEYYKAFARRYWFIAVITMIALFISVTAWSLTATKEVDREQIRQASLIDRNTERYNQILDRLNKIDGKIEDLGKLK